MNPTRQRAFIAAMMAPKSVKRLAERFTIGMSGNSDHRDWQDRLKFIFGNCMSETVYEGEFFDEVILSVLHKGEVFYFRGTK